MSYSLDFLHTLGEHVRQLLRKTRLVVLRSCVRNSILDLLHLLLLSPNVQAFVFSASREEWAEEIVCRLGLVRDSLQDDYHLDHLGVGGCGLCICLHKL